MRFGFGPLTLESPVGWRCVGCSRPADGSCCGKKQVDVFEEGLEQAVTAEWWGFDSVWAGEANFSKVGFNSSSPVVAAGIAQRTEFVRVGVMPTLGLVNAIYLAEEVACIDNIAAGRAIVAAQVPSAEVARGWGGSNSAERIIDDIAVLRKAGGPNPFSHKSEFHTIPMENEIHVEARGLDKISIQPKPAQLEMPLWLTGDAAAASIARQVGVPYLGAAQLTLDELRPLYEGVPTDGSVIVPLSREVFIAPTTERAYELAANAIAGLYEAFRKDGTYSGPSNFDEMVKDRFVIGNPDTCIEQLYRYQNELGVNYVVARLAYHDMHPGETAKAIQLFGQGVVPEFRMFGMPDEIRKVV